MQQKTSRPLLYIAIAITFIALIVHWIWTAPYDDATTVILILVIAMLVVFPYASSIKIFDAFEVKRDVQDLKKNVDERFDYVNKTISTLSSVLTATQTVTSKQNTFVNTNINNQLEGLEKLVEMLTSKYDLSESTIEAQEQDLPRTSNVYEQVVTIFRLRFLIEEKVKKIAQMNDITYEQVLEAARMLYHRQLIDHTLFRSIENIIRITDEIVRTGFELSTNMAGQILENGKYVLAALDRVKERRN